MEISRDSWIPIFHLCSPVFPFKLALEKADVTFPTTRPGSLRDFMDQFESIAVGSKIYNVRAFQDPNDNTGKLTILCNQLNLIFFRRCSDNIVRSYWKVDSFWSRNWGQDVMGPTTLQSIMNAKLNQHRFWHCYENRLIKTIQMIPHNLEVSFKLTSLYCVSLILVYANPQQREDVLTLTYRLWGIVWIVLLSLFS